MAVTLVLGTYIDEILILKKFVIFFSLATAI